MTRCHQRIEAPARRAAAAAVVCLLLLAVPTAAAVKKRGPGRAASPGAGRDFLSISTPQAAPQEGRWYLLESGPVSFGDVQPDVEKEMPGAIRVRVFSDREWVLKLISASPLIPLDRHDPMPLSRLAWRSRLSGGFVPLAENRPATVARGSRTEGAGELVVIDLRLRFASADEIGRYGCEVRLLLEDM